MASYTLTIQPNDRDLYARISLAVANSNKLLPHACSRAVKEYLATVDREHLLNISTEEAAHEAVQSYSHKETASPIRRSPLKASSSSSSSSTLSASARATLQRSYVPPSVSPIKTKPYLDPSDINASPGRGFTLPPPHKLKPSPEKGFWKDMVKRDTVLAEAEKQQKLQKRIDMTNTVRATLDAQMDARRKLLEAEQQAKDELAARTLRDNKDRARKYREEQRAKIEKHAKEVNDLEAFNAKEQAFKNAARQAELAKEKEILDMANAKRIAAQKAEEEKIRKRKEMIAQFMKQNEVELEQKHQTALRMKEADAQLTRENEKAAAEKERLRLAEIQRRMEEMKAKLDRMGSFLADKNDADRIAAEKAAKELAARQALTDKAAAERARKHHELLEACGTAMRDQIREKQEARLRAQEEAQIELQRLRDIARENTEKEQEKKNRRRAEAIKLMHETEQVLLDKARSKVTPDQTTTEVSMNAHLLDTRKGRGTCPW